LPAGWRLVDEPTARSLIAELRRECGTSHRLFGRNVRVIAVNSTEDDVLFSILDEKTPILAEVHLTWRPEKSSSYPWTTTYECAEDWRSSKVSSNEL
jgi:hypothetical protein